MSGQPISLSDLRERNPFIDDTPDDVLLALVEAVEAAQEDFNMDDDESCMRLMAALSRFTDHKETRLCDCGRADVMDDRGLCGYCIEELDERHRNAEPEAPDGCP